MKVGQQSVKEIVVLLAKIFELSYSWLLQSPLLHFVLL